MSDQSKPPIKGRFEPGNPGKPRGAVTKTTKVLREAILEAAEAVGMDGRGKDGLLGYLKFVAATEPKAFVGLLGRVLPMQVQASLTTNIRRIELVPLESKPLQVIEQQERLQ